MPREYEGWWHTEKSKITVRYKFEGHTRYISDSVIVRIRINPDKTADGGIGSAVFHNGLLRKNISLPWESGIKYVIKCGLSGKIFENYASGIKYVEIWLGPITASGKIKAEVRMSNFPMADLIFARSNH